MNYYCPHLLKLTENERGKLAPELQLSLNSWVCAM